MTSAPMSPRNMEPNGPARMRVKSMTRIPVRGARERAGRADVFLALFTRLPDVFLALFTWPPFQESLDEALADGRHLLPAIPCPAPEEARPVGESQVREVEDRVHVFHGDLRSNLDAASLLAVAEKAGSS